MGRIQVLFGQMAPSLYRQLEGVIAMQPDMEVVGTSGNRGVRLLIEVREAKPHVVVIGSKNGELPGECSHLFGEFPELKILAIPGEDNTALLYDLRPRGTPVPYSSPEDLIATIRSAIKGNESQELTEPRAATTETGPAPRPEPHQLWRNADMATPISATISVVVPGVGTVSHRHTLKLVEAIDKIEVEVPPNGGMAEVEVQPGGAGRVQLLLITAKKYSDPLSYTVDGGAADVPLDAPHIMLGVGAVNLLGSPPKKITFSNAGAGAIEVGILVGRDATL